MRSAIEKMMFVNAGVIHFVGIGGIGMSGIAEILHNLGYQVQGSDLGENDNILRLRNIGIKIFIGHIAQNIEAASVLVKSTAVKEDNIEIKTARLRHIPVVQRSEMLAELMRLKISVAVSGAHGKTTTTALIASMFEAANLNPTVINGGIINTRGTNAYLGSGDYLIAEADESDGTFIRIPATIAVITNIDPEHLDYYRDFQSLKNAYSSFIHNLPFYGFAVVCKDHPEVKNLVEKIQDREIITYGIEEENLDVQAINVVEDMTGSYFDVRLSAKLGSQNDLLKDIKLSLPGRHNILNALSAIAIGMKLKISISHIINAFSEFQGVKRRFTKTGKLNGAIVIDDYAHHPAEIAATLKTARQVINHESKVIAILQPHRYSRVENLLSEFTHCVDDADVLFVADIYAAGEQKIPGINKEVLISSLRQNYKNKEILSLDSSENLYELLANKVKPGDIIVFMGAGTVTKWANDLPKYKENNQF
jgi:UDP-N-acetylmuramate--alanine ligase